MEGSALPLWPFLLFPLVLAALWLGVTRLLHHLSGWARLQDAYPDREDRVSERLGMASGVMGWPPPFGVNYGHCLTLEVCRTGLRAKVWRLIGPFSAPFLVPWKQITVRPRRFLFWRYYRLALGQPVQGHLSLSRRAAERVATASGGKFVLPR